MTNEPANKSLKKGYLKDIQVRNMSVPTLSEKLQGLPGTIYFERRDSGVIEAYFRYTLKGMTRRKRKIGFFRISERGGGLPLAEIRAEAKKLGEIARDHGDIESYFEGLELGAEAEKREAERLHAIATAQSSFAELFQDYINERRGKVAERQIKEYENLFNGDLVGAFPEILSLKAKDVEPAHISMILQKVWDRGSHRQAEKLRSFLHAAFVIALKSEHRVGKVRRKGYGLVSNPVQAVPVDSTSKAGERALTDSELKQFWDTIDKTPGVGPVIANAFRFVIATGGQRYASGQVIYPTPRSQDMVCT